MYSVIQSQRIKGYWEVRNTAGWMCYRSESREACQAIADKWNA